MKTIFIFFVAVLANLLPARLFAQNSLTFTPSEDEFSIRVFPYDDGGFSTYSIPASSKKDGIFRTYDANDKLVLEKSIPYVFAFEGETSTRTHKDFDRMMKVSHFNNTTSGEEITFGYKMNEEELFCRILNRKGEIREVKVPKKESSLFKYSIVGFGPGKDGGVAILLSTVKLINNSHKLLQINNTKTGWEVEEISESLDNTPYLMFAGYRGPEMMFLGFDLTKSLDKKNQAALLQISNKGVVTKIEDSKLPDNANIIVEPVVNLTDTGNGYFSVRKITSDSTTSTTMDVFRISGKNGIDAVTWTIPPDLFDQQTQSFGSLKEYGTFPLLTIFPGEEELLLYSYLGFDLAVFNIDWDQQEVSDFDEEKYYSKVRASAPLDFVPFIQRTTSFTHAQKELERCISYGSGCKFLIRTIIHADGTYGLVTILSESDNGFHPVEMIKY